jgi:hypothetical protein
VRISARPSRRLTAKPGTCSLQSAEQVPDQPLGLIGIVRLPLGAQRPSERGVYLKIGGRRKEAGTFTDSVVAKCSWNIDKISSSGGEADAEHPG